MTKMQDEYSPTTVVGSFADDRSYAMRITSSFESRDEDCPGAKAGVSPHHPPSVVTPSSQIASPSRPQPCRLQSIQRLEDRELSSVVVAINPVAQEIGSADNSITASHNSSGSGHSTARVELTDIGEDSYNFTTSTLRKCKHQVLKPYWGLLMFIGWRSFRHDMIRPMSVLLRALNVVYPTMIILLLLYTYLYEMVVCEWKLDVTKALNIVTSPKPTQAPRNISFTTAADDPYIPLGPATTEDNGSNAGDSNSSPQPCDHIVTTYLIPNFLHFLAYIVGLYYFRIQDNEQMYALMEKVFLQANPLHSSSSSQQKLVRKTRMFLVFGCLWVLMTLSLQVLYVWAFDFPRMDIFQTYGRTFHWVTFGVELLGRMVFNSVLLAVVINYATQCEMVMFYVRGLTLRLQEKSTDIKTAFKDTLLLRQNLSLLNGVISKMTTLALIILAELTVLGLSILALNRYDVASVWVYRSIFPFVWALMLCFPLFQAARVNSVCLRIKKISLEMRVFGYKNSSQLELDSFLQFSHSTRLRAKLFHVPIHPSYMMAICILASFIFLILVQTSNVVSTNNIF